MRACIAMPARAFRRAGLPGPHRLARPGRTARTPSGQPARTPRERSASPGEAQRPARDCLDYEAGPARPQRGALGRSGPRRAASRCLSASSAPPVLPLPQFSQASLRLGVAASKKCSPPSSDSRLPSSPRFLPSPNFSRLCFPFLLLPTLQPLAQPLAPPGDRRTVGSVGWWAGPQRGRGRKHGLGGSVGDTAGENAKKL